MNVQKSNVLVTGATSGLGYAFATIFAEKHYNLFLASRNQQSLDEMKRDFESKYDVLVATRAIDLSEPKSAYELFVETLTQNIVIDVLINNAGVGIRGQHVDQEISKVVAMVQLNVTTLTELCMFFGAEMKRRRKGYILNVASTAGYQPLPYLAAYSGTKGYVLNFSEALAKELEDYNVVVTCLSPGPTNTNFFNAAGIGDRKTGFFANRGRMSSTQVAMVGVNSLFSKRLSIIPGFKNSTYAFLNRFSPRGITATIAKKLMSKSIND